MVISKVKKASAYFDIKRYNLEPKLRIFSQNREYVNQHYSADTTMYRKSDFVFVLLCLKRYEKAPSKVAYCTYSSST